MTEHNSDELEKFREINSLNKSNGWSLFKGNIKIETEKDFYQGSFNVRLWFSGMTAGNVVIDIDETFDTANFPSDFWITRTVYRCIGNKLIITGKHPFPNIGKYTCEISV